MKLYRLAILGLFMLTAMPLAAVGASAAEELDFIDKNSFYATPSHQNIQFNKHDGDSLAAIALIDLNNDGLNEYIGTSSTDDHHTVFKQFHIFSSVDSSQKQPISLGAIYARKLMVSYNVHHGVRDILAYVDPINDFQYDVYLWDPLSSRYQHKNDLELGAQQREVKL